MPWVPLFVAAAFLLNAIFGWLAIGTGILTFMIAVANEYLTRRSLSRATQSSISAHADVAATLRNSEVMRAMGMAPGLKERWGQRRDEQIAWQAVASDRGSALTASMKSFRQITQGFILGLGGYLCIQGCLSAAAIVAASNILRPALAPLPIAVSQSGQFQNSRGAWSGVPDL